jgi:hypothetical protein
MPANSKKSRLILGFFTVPDLIVLGIGVTVTAALLLMFQNAGLLFQIIAVIPGAFAGLLVFPVPHYHNVMQLIVNIFMFFTGRRRYEWKGWSIDDGK